MIIIKIVNMVGNILIVVIIWIMVMIIITEIKMSNNGN
jgi:hypothetical protein